MKVTKLIVGYLTGDLPDKSFFFLGGRGEWREHLKVAYCIEWFYLPSSS